MLFPGNTFLGLEFISKKHLYRVEWLANTEENKYNFFLWGEKEMLLTQTRFSLVSIDILEKWTQKRLKFSTSFVH